MNGPRMRTTIETPAAVHRCAFMLVTKL